MVNKKYIGSTTYVSDASRLTDTYGYNGDVAYVIDDLLKKILSEYTKFNGHWIEVQTDSSGGEDYATGISISINTTTYVMTVQLLDKNGDPLGEAQSIDLPLESTVVNGSYDSQSKSLILTLVSGQTITIPLEDIINGLQAEITAQNKLSADLVDDTTTTNKFVTASEKQTWDGKQDALTFDDVPTQSSTNPVKSGGVYAALDDKQDIINIQHKLSSDLVDDTNSTNKFATAAQLAQIATNKTDIASIQQTIGNINTVLEGVL